jgi:SNF2 family DNA or RNA helicase
LIVAVTLNDLKSSMVEASQQVHNIFLTSYEFLQKEIIFFSQSIWENIVLDEAHIIKNPHSSLSKAIFSLKCSFKIVLTGTPVQNQVKQQYFSITDFIIFLS